MTDLTAPAVEDIGSVSNFKVPTVTTEQARGMADALIQSGMDPARVEAALRRDGFAPAEPDTRTDDQKDFDTSFGGADPSAYRIEYIGRLPIGVETEDLAAFNTAATGWLSAAGFPENIGPGVIERAMETNAMLKRMTETDLELWRREQAVEFERLAGSPERAAERQATAAKVLERGGAFTETLRSAGVLADAGVLTFLALQGEREAARAS